MGEINNSSIILKERIDMKDYKDIVNLEKLCLENDKTTLKLELDYKLSLKEGDPNSINDINEFMYYEDNKLIGYIGLCSFGGDALEVNGMVHPEYRRRGIFNRLFNLVIDEWGKRKSRKILLLSDSNSISGIGFISNTNAAYAHSEFEMYIKDDAMIPSLTNNITFRKATVKDSIEIARQDSIFFEKEYNEEDISNSNIEELNGSDIYLAEIDNKVIGKIRLELINDVGGIYGFGVLPEYRGKGYGRGILSWAINKLKEMKAKDIILQVSVTNKNALNLYKSCGFEVTSTMDYYEMSK